MRSKTSVLFILCDGRVEVNDRPGRVRRAPRWSSPCGPMAGGCREECLDEDVDPAGARGAGPRDRRGVAALAASAARPAPAALCAFAAQFSRTTLTIDGVANSGPARRRRRI